MRSREIPSMERHAGIAKRHGIRYITYEGGPSIHPGAGDLPGVRKALWDAQRSPELSHVPGVHGGLQGHARWGSS
jgi:hypothetical protein